MICKNCRESFKDIKAENLILNANGGCAYCKYISNEIDSICLKSRSEYQHDIIQWLSSNTPIKDGNNLIMANSREYRFPRFDEDQLISEIIRQLELDNKIFTTNEEKYSAVNKILGLLYDDFFDKIRSNTIQCLIDFLSCLEYSRFMANTIVLWLKDNAQEREPTQDKLVNIVIDTFNLIKTFETFNQYMINNLDINKLYLSFENLLALDRLSLEHGIELAVSKIQKEKVFFSEEINNRPTVFGETLRSLRAISTIKSIKTEFTEGINKDIPLIFNSVGEVTNEKIYNNLAQTYINDMTHQKSIYDFNNYNETIDNIVKDNLGFSLNTIQTILKKSQPIFTVGDDFLAGDTLSWCKALEELGDCNSEEAASIFKYFTYSILNMDIYGNQSRKNNRIMRKPIVVIDDVAICVVNTFSFALMGFYYDVFDGELQDENLIQALSVVHNKIDLDFEDAVFNEIRSAFINSDYSIVKKNIKELDIQTKKDEIIRFPGQIDILLLYKNKIIVIECKNFNLRIDPKSVSNEFGKLTKNNPKSIQAKLDKKVNWIKENIVPVAKFMGGDCSVEYSIVGVITTSHFSLLSVEQNLKYPIVTWTNLCDWIQNQ